MSNLSQRLKETLLKANLSQQQVADAIGVTQGTISKIIRGETTNPRYLPDIARRLNVSVEWLMTGNDVPDGVVFTAENVALEKDYYVINISDINTKERGNSVWVSQSEHDALIFKRAWFAKRLLKPDHCRALRILGKSMEPDLLDQDVILLDITAQHIVEGEIYAVIYKNVFLVKKIKRTKEGLMLISSHPDFETFEVTENSDLIILGRKIWRCG